MSKKNKNCPFCGEEILAVAVKCKHCQSMLDGSGNNQKVTVAGQDPFAEYHTPIQGKKKGRITLIGWLGILLGFLFMFAGISIFSGSTSGADEQAGYFFLIGLGFSISSYLWVRR